MHMADALISVPVGLGFYAASGALLAYSAKYAVRQPGYESRLPLMGIMGAFIFAAQMINFSIPGTGSSGHLVGGLLMGALLGSEAGFLVIASVIVFQSIFFADGGLLALGCNLFNMGFFSSFIGLAVFGAVRRHYRGSFSLLIGSIVGSAVALELGALSVVFQTSLSGRSELPFGVFSGIMLSIHLPIAVVEGMVTAGILNYVYRAEPHAFQNDWPPNQSVNVPLLATLGGCAFFLATFGAWFASSQPDGLEWSLEKIYGSSELPAATAGTAAFLAKVQKTTAVLPDYSFSGSEQNAVPEEVENKTKSWPAVEFGTSAAGFIGALAVALFSLLLGRVLYLFRRSFLSRAQ